MLQLPVCQNPAGKSESFGAAWRRLMEMVVRTPIMLPQFSITILLLDGYRWRWNYATQLFFASFIVANMPTAQMVPRCLCVVATATFLWMTSSHLQPMIWSTLSGRNRTMMVRRGAPIQEASPRRKQASKSLNVRFKRGLSDSSNTLKSSKTVLLVSLPITSKPLLLMRMWLGYLSTITLWILLLQALWPIGSLQAATQLQISRCEDGMHWLYGCSRICVVGGYSSGTLEGGRMGDNLEFFGEVLGLFLVFCLFYYYIIHIHAGRAVFRVQDAGINHWDVYFWEWHSGSNRTPCMAIL